MQQSIVLILGIATAITIAILSLLRGDSRLFSFVPRWLPPIGHLLLYGVLAFFTTLALQSAELAAPLPALGGVLLATGLGTALEYAQNFRPGRYSRVSDAVIDAVGAVIGASLALL